MIIFLTQTIINQHYLTQYPMSKIIAWIFIWFGFSISICIFVILYLLFQYITQLNIQFTEKKLPNWEQIISFIFINVHKHNYFISWYMLQYKLKFYYQFNVYYFIINFARQSNMIIWIWFTDIESQLIS